MSAHPDANSYTAAIRDQVVAALGARHEVDLLDLYAEGFVPELSARAHELRMTHVSPHVFSGDLRLEPGFQADLLSFVLFDGEFASRLVALGRKDAAARAAEIHRFFDA